MEYYQWLTLNTPDNNVAIGAETLKFLGENYDRYYTWDENENLRPAQGNIAIGMTALKSLREGPNNTVVGTYSFISLSEGDSNVAIGNGIFPNLSNGSQNVFVGNNIGWDNETTLIDGITLIGSQTDVVSGVLNSTAIGAGAIVTSSNTIQLGDQ